MSVPYLLIFGHVLLLSLGAYVGKIFVNKLHPAQILFYQYLASALTISAWLALTNPQDSFPRGNALFLIIGLFFSLGVFANYFATRESLSKTELIGKMDIVLTIVLAVIFLGEYQLLLPSAGGWKKIIGLCLAVCTLVIFYQKKTHAGSESTFHYSEWKKWVTGRIVILGVMTAFVKYAVTHAPPLQVLQYQYIGSFFMAMILCFILRQKIILPPKTTLGLLCMGACVSIALGFLYQALSFVSATQLLPIVSVTMPIVMAVAGAVAFKEKLNFKVSIAFVLGLVAIYFLR